MSTPPATSSPRRKPPADKRARVAGIRILHPDRRIMFSRMSQEIITIGRDSRRDICICDDSVSRLHCVITPGPGHGTYQIHDCKAKNGVYVSDLEHPGRRRRVDRHPLAVGMTVQLGSVTMVPVDARGESPAIDAPRARSRVRIVSMLEIVRFVLTARRTDDE